MKTLNKPELKVLRTGDSLKILEISGLAGMIMLPHHTTKESVLVVQEGRAWLKMPTTVHVLQPGMSFTIPAHAAHSLEVKEDFKALLIMEMDADMEFD